MIKFCTENAALRVMWHLRSFEVKVTITKSIFSVLELYFSIYLQAGFYSVVKELSRSLQRIFSATHGLWSTTWLQYQRQARISWCRCWMQTLRAVQLPARLYNILGSNVIKRFSRNCLQLIKHSLIICSFEPLIFLRLSHSTHSRLLPTISSEDLKE